MSFHNDGDGLSDEKEEDLQSLLTEDNSRLGIRYVWWCKPNLGVSVQLNSEPSWGLLKDFWPHPPSIVNISNIAFWSNCWGTHQTVRSC